MSPRIPSLLTVATVASLAFPCSAQQQYNGYPVQNSVPRTQQWQTQPVAMHWTQKVASSNRVHDFGVVPSFSNQEFVFEFANAFEYPIYLTGVRASCGCTRPEIRTPQVAPGETGQVLAKFDTKNFQGEKKATISVSVRRDQPYSEYGEIQFEVKGTIRRDVVLSPGAVSFDEVMHGDSDKRAVSILYAGNPQWQIRDIKSTNPNITVSTREIQRNPQTQRVDYELTLELAGQQDIGQFSDQLLITTNDVKNKNLAVNIFGNVKAAVQVSPIRLIVEQGDKVEKRLIVRGDRPFGIKSVSTGDQRIQFSPVSGSKTLHILIFSLNTETVGQIASNITIETDDPQQAPTTVSFDAQIVPATFARDETVDQE